jgi:hypothetical protein
MDGQTYQAPALQMVQTWKTASWIPTSTTQKPFRWIPGRSSTMLLNLPRHLRQRQKERKLAGTAGA